MNKPVITAPKLIAGGFFSYVILSILMRYNSKIAWLYLIVILLGVMVVYRDIIFTQFSLIGKLLSK